jgi:hypothetical protein
MLAGTAAPKIQTRHPLGTAALQTCQDAAKNAFGARNTRENVPVPLVILLVCASVVDHDVSHGDD